MGNLITNLVFKGGGVLGIAYAGALKVLEDKGMLAGIQAVAGTSAGAMTAALVSLNYGAADIKSIVSATNFSTFQDGLEPLRLGTKYGLYKGDSLMSWIQTQITNKGLDKSATFTDLKTQGYKDLHVFATDLNAQGLQEFSFDQTPTAIVAEAVRASMSIPMFFSAWKFSNSVPNNHVFVDGGTIYNYPITAFDATSIPNTATLGFYLTDMNNSGSGNDLDFDQPFKYVRALFETLMDAQVVDFVKNPEELKRTIQIDDLGISATNFNLSADQEAALYQSGIDHTTTFFNNC